MAAPRPAHLPPPLTFHHVGLACRDLEVERAAHLALGYEVEGEVFEDPAQRIRGLFMTLGPFRVELLEPWGDDSPAQGWVRRGVKLYHVCYETDRLEESLQSLVEAGGRVVSPPTPAVAFGDRAVSFVMVRTMSLLELLQR